MATTIQRTVGAAPGGFALMLLVLTACASAASSPRTASSPRATSRHNGWVVPGRAAAVVAGPGINDRRFDDCVYDVDGKRAYLPNPDHTVDAIALDTGITIGRVAERGMPLAALPGNAVAVYVDGVIEVHDRDHGALLMTSQPLAVRRFEYIENALFIDGAIEINWTHFIPGNSECCDGGGRTEQGRDVVELATGKVAHTDFVDRGLATRFENLHVTDMAPPRAVTVRLDGGVEWTHTLPAFEIYQEPFEPGANQEELPHQ